ncbi:MAG: nitrite reductase (NADH) small subunit [Arenicella sp.]|jgi:nitrite reductase (NADH) small subunit
MTTAICSVDALAKNSGVCALLTINGQQQQVAIYYLPDTEQKVFALGNWDPLGQANVMSRGILGNVGDELVVASPLYKQHFSLISGKCLEDDVSVPVFSIAIEGQNVVLVS